MCAQENCYTTCDTTHDPNAVIALRRTPLRDRTGAARCALNSRKRVRLHESLMEFVRTKGFCCYFVGAVCMDFACADKNMHTLEM